MISLLCFATIGRAADVTVHPPFWFTGLKNPELQLFISSPNINKSVNKVRLSNTRATIKSVNALTSPNYLIIYLDVSKAQPGVFKIYFTTDSGEFSVDYELKKKREYRPRMFDSSDVIYLLMPDRFSNGNKSHIDIPMTKEYKVDRTNPDSRHGGDIRGLINHLDYFTELGVTAIWHTPVVENDCTGGSYHGYAATNSYKVDPRFGTNEEYVEFVQKAHEKGLKVIFDIVFNHISSEHPWMADVPEESFFNNLNNYVQCHHDKTISWSPYASEYDANKFLTGWFVPSMPDLNQRNRHVTRYLIQSSIWWIEYADLDGLRQDTYPYSFPEAMREWTAEIEAEYPDFNIVGEIWIGNTIGTAFWQSGTILNKNETGLKSVMDFRLQELSRDVFSGEDRLGQIHEHLGFDFVYGNASNVVRFVENHDTDRFLMQATDDPAALKMAYAFLMTIPGIPQIYYGTEMLMDGNKSQTDGYVRKDFPGGFEGDADDWFDASKRTGARKEAFDFISSVLHFRKNNSVVSRGTMKHFYPIDGVYVMYRRYGEQSFITLLNGRSAEVVVNPGPYSEILKCGTVFEDVHTGQRYDWRLNFTVPAKAAIVMNATFACAVDPTPTPEPTNSGLTKGDIAGIVVAGCVALVLLCIPVVYCVKPKKDYNSIPSIN